MKAQNAFDYTLMRHNIAHVGTHVWFKGQKGDDLNKSVKYSFVREKKAITLVKLKYLTS